MFDLTGQVAVITGASAGLGVQLAEALARQGANIAILARRLEKLETIAEEIREKYQVKVLPIATDVTDTDEVNAARDKVIETFGKVDILVNNAGGSKQLK